MKFLFASLLLLTLAAAGLAQNSKVMAEAVRSSEKTVKGAPFSAEAVSSSVQMLADGNKITRSTTSRIYRDSEGRYRRENMPKQIGVPGAVVEMPESILIIDPVAGYRYELNSKKNTARQFVLKSAFDFKMKYEFKLKSDEFKLKMETKKAEMAAKHAERSAKQAERAARAERPVRNVIDVERKKEIEKQIEKKIERTSEVNVDRTENDKRIKKIDPEKQAIADAKTESLGVRNIEGIDAEGTRTTKTIPAGAIGNERAIDIVYEKWYSKELQLIVLSKHYDPSFGEQTYRLTNINRSEPSITLFSPPADYTIIDQRRPQPKPAAVPKPPSADKKPPTPPATRSGPKKAGDQ